jgi:hypothetical protein
MLSYYVVRQTCCGWNLRKYASVEAGYKLQSTGCLWSFFAYFLLQISEPQKDSETEDRLPY